MLVPSPSRRTPTRARRAVFALVVPLAGCHPGDPVPTTPDAMSDPNNTVVAVDILGEGTVSYTPPAGADCSNADPQWPKICPIVTYRNGGATLLATPAPGWTFTGWALAYNRDPSTAINNPSSPSTSVVPGSHVWIQAHFSTTNPPASLPCSGGPGGAPTACGGALQTFNGVQVSHITATFDEPNRRTTYQVTIGNADGHVLNYHWSGPNCGDWSPQDETRTALPDLDAQMTWSHPHPPCGDTPDHRDTTIMFTVVDRTANATIVCSYEGAATGVGPDCTLH